MRTSLLLGPSLLLDPPLSLHQTPRLTPALTDGHLSPKLVVFSPLEAFREGRARGASSLLCVEAPQKYSSTSLSLTCSPHIKHSLSHMLLSSYMILEDAREAPVRYHQEHLPLGASILGSIKAGFSVIIRK